jgi:hypothetical protein
VGELVEPPCGVLGEEPHKRHGDGGLIEVKPYKEQIMNKKSRASFTPTAATLLAVFALASLMACQEPVSTSPALAGEIELRSML